jgi:TetR/AcrR family transcriptional regulator, transcriptional repressor for nem operon
MTTRGDSTRERILEAAEALVFDRGYAGTSLDEIIERGGVTKGAFFYHFKSKADLAKGIVERFARREQELFSQWAERASALAEDPLQDVLLFFKLFEEFVDGIDEPLPGCMFASYAYERRQFDDSINALVRKELEDWAAHYEKKFERLIEWREPRIPVTAQELSEAAVCLIEGALLLGRVYTDSKLLTRQSNQFRNYLQLLFGAN